MPTEARALVSPPFSVYTYSEIGEPYHLDADRFRLIGYGCDNDDEYFDQAGTLLTGHGTGVRWWKHQSLTVLEFPAAGFCDLPYARKRDERVWQMEFRTIICDIEADSLTFANAASVYVVRCVPDIDSFFYTQQWARWSKEGYFERRMRHRPGRSESLFPSWTNVELFAIAVRDRPTVFHLVDRCWQELVEIAPFYMTFTPLLFVYHTAFVLIATANRLREYMRVATSQFAELAIPVILSTARYGTWHKDIHDGRIRLVAPSDLSRAVIGPLSGEVWECYDHWNLVDVLCRTSQAALNLLVF